jgi:hypothetical protein
MREVRAINSGQATEPFRTSNRAVLKRQLAENKELVFLSFHIPAQIPAIDLPAFED